MIRDALRLDHFYVELPSHEIKEIRFLKKSGIAYSESATTSGKDSWRGIYLRSNLGTYFEILEQDPSRFGLAFSIGTPQCVDARKITSELPHLPWQKGRRYLGKTKRPWFDWVDLDTPKIGGKHSPFYAWIMHYYSFHNERYAKRRRQSALERFRSLRLSMGREHLAILRANAKWLPGTFYTGKRTAGFELQDRDGGSFSVDIQLRAGSEPPIFIGLEGQACPLVRTYGGASHSFRLSSRSDKLTLERKRGS